MVSFNFMSYCSYYYLLFPIIQMPCGVEKTYLKYFPQKHFTLVLYNSSGFITLNLCLVETTIKAHI